MRGALDHLAEYKAETVDMPSDMTAFLTKLRELNQQQSDAEAVLANMADASMMEVQQPNQAKPRSGKKGAAAATGGSEAAAGVAAYEAARARVAGQAVAVIDLAEHKLRLAQEMYDYVDRRIVALQDSNAAYQQHIFAEQARLGLDLGKTAREELGIATAAGAKDKVKALMRKKVYKTAEVLEVPGEGAILADQREPTYCYCKKVSYGEMIACDAPDCPIEWFHYDCVGLPAGYTADHWLCKECAAAAAAAAGGGTGPGTAGASTAPPSCTTTADDCAAATAGGARAQAAVASALAGAGVEGS